jgi:putative ABC transport system permease protein
VERNFSINCCTQGPLYYNRIGNHMGYIHTNYITWTGKRIRAGGIGLFNGLNRNTVTVNCKETSEPYRGLKSGRKILLRYDDMKLLKSSVMDIENISPEISRFCLISNNNKFSNNSIRGVSPEYFNIKQLKTIEGRLFNYLDDNEKRRVVLLGKLVAELLFKKEISVGKYVNINNSYFLVIGVIKSNNIMAFEDYSVFIPYKAFVNTYSESNDISAFHYSTKHGTDDVQIEQKVKRILSKKYEFNEQDEKTLEFNSSAKTAESFDKLFNGIRYFLWILGISTLLSGVIGVGNIMFVIVKERTKEIGVRKAIGAKPYIIKIMILSEAIIFTLLAGFLGIFLGFIVLELISWGLEGAGLEIFTKEATVNLSTVLTAFVVLIISGTLAGLIPASKAANLSPILALKDE